MEPDAAPSKPNKADIKNIKEEMLMDMAAPAATHHDQEQVNQKAGRNVNGSSCSSASANSATVVSTSIKASATATATAAADQQPNRSYLLKCGHVMTDEQFETLRRQISVYSTICSQLVEMHKAVMAQQSLIPSMLAGGQQLSFDPVLGARSSGRQRWTPSQVQLQILENLFEKSNGTPSKQKIKEITADLGQHGQISETNVYNWFQNRKARAKRKQQFVTLKDGDSELEMDEVESRKDKRPAIEMFHENSSFGKEAFSYDGTLSSISNSSTNMLEGPGVDTSTMCQEGFAQKGGREFSTMIVLIDGKPWEVPAGALDLKGSFGEGSALLDSHRQMVPTDETGFTIHPLCAGESYTLVKLATS